MEVSLGFLVVLILILFPGLIYRRLYFYGEFSKEFGGGHNLAGLLAISTIPGMVMLVLSFVSYSYIFQEIDIAEIIDKFKDINNPEYRLSSNHDTKFNELIEEKVTTFVGFQYLISSILGALSGRLIRITKLDTKFKLLRFKNYWFYIFNGQHDGFKKLKHLKPKNRKHLFTKADVLIDSSGKTLLYSGIVVDYELSEKENSSLSKIYLQNAERYSTKGDERVRVEIPGTLLVVDCSSLKNINLTYIYEENKDLLKSKIPNFIEVLFGLIYMLSIPAFIFKAESLNFRLYDEYFNQSWYFKVLSYLLFIQVLSLTNPFVKSGEEYTYITWRIILLKLIWTAVFIFLIWIIL